MKVWEPLVQSHEWPKVWIEKKIYIQHCRPDICFLDNAIQWKKKSKDKKQEEELEGEEEAVE